jgi:hypothetical protein
MRRLSRLGSVLFALILAATALAGCGEIEIKVLAGKRVDPALLESELTLGQSTSEDIQKVLGEPLGVGRDLLPFQSEPRTVMSYYFEESQGSLTGAGNSKRMFVWVFVKAGRYDGYLWVSGFPEDRQTP